MYMAKVLGRKVKSRVLYWQYKLQDGKIRAVIAQPLDRRGNLPLVIDNKSADQEGSWSTELDGEFHQCLLACEVLFSSDGPCLKQVGDDNFIGGICLQVQACSRAQDSFGSKYTVDQTWSPLGGIATTGSMRCELITPPDCIRIRLRLCLSGEGVFRLTDLSITTTDYDENFLSNRLVDQLISTDKRPVQAVEEAMRVVLRSRFLPQYNPALAFQNAAIVTKWDVETREPISSCSEPAIVAIMLNQLALTPGLRVLEIGTGTGYNAALMAHMLQDGSNVWTVDLDEDVCNAAQNNLNLSGHGDVNVLHSDGWDGYFSAAPYNRIIVTACVYDLPTAWLHQLTPAGVLVVPFGSSAGQQRLLTFRKENNALKLLSSEPCAFMKMRGRGDLCLQPPTMLDDMGKPNRIMLPNSLLSSWDIMFLLLVMSSPFVAGRFQFSGSENIYGSGNTYTGIFDPDLSGACVLDSADFPSVLFSWGEDFTKQMHKIVTAWESLGTPGPDELQMVVYERPSSEVESGNAIVAHWRWMDCVLSVSNGK